VVAPTAQAEINTPVLSRQNDVVADTTVNVPNDKEELDVKSVDVKDAEPIEQTPLTMDVDVKKAEELATVTVSPPEPTPVADMTQDNASMVPEATIEETPLPSQDEVPAKEPETAATSDLKPESVAELTPATEPDRVTEVDVAPLASKEESPKEETPAPVDSAHTLAETLTIVMEPVAHEVEEVEDKSKGIPLTESPVIESSVQELYIVSTKGDGALKPVPFEHSPPHTPRSATTPRFSSPVTPRKRVNSEGQTTKDKDIMDELQASVRSREKKRKEQERIQAAEREKKKRELSVKLEKERQEEIARAGESDGDEILREVRSWRKQREASLKASPENAAKIAAYREAFAREEIMIELQSAVQNRTVRGPYKEDPVEKRQRLLLEEIYARRVPAMEA